METIVWYLQCKYTTSCEQWEQLFDTYSVNTPQAVNNGNNCLIQCKYTTSCERWKQLFDTYSVNTPQAVNNGNNCLILTV